MDDSPDEADRPNESDATDGAETDDEFERERAHDRTDLAAVFREFATAFESGRPIRLNSDDRSVRVGVPERVVAEFEAELDAEADPPVGELEIELEWDDPDGSSVRVTDRESADADRSDRDAENGSDPDPAAAVMPLEGLTGHDGRADDRGTDETAVTAEDAGSEDPSEGGRTSRFEVYEDRGGQWRWRLVHWNGNIVADSGEGYASRSNAERAARSVMRSAPTATVERLE